MTSSHIVHHIGANTDQVWSVSRCQQMCGWRLEQDIRQSVVMCRLIATIITHSSSQETRQTQASSASTPVKYQWDIWMQVSLLAAVCWRYKVSQLLTCSMRHDGRRAATILPCLPLSMQEEILTLLHRSSTAMWQLCACYHFNYSNEILICLSGIVNYYNLYFRFIWDEWALEPQDEIFGCGSARCKHAQTF